MRWLLLILVLGALWHTPVLSAPEKETVTVLFDDNYPPYSYINPKTQQPDGIYYKVLIRAFEKLTDYQIKVRFLPWKRGLQMIRAGRALALVPPYLRTGERPFMWPYSIPILDERLVLFCRKGAVKKAESRWPEDFLGLKIGINRGFSTLESEQDQKLIKEGKIIVEDAAGSSANILKLIRKRIDCYANDRFSILWALKSLRKEKKISEADLRSVSEAATITVEQGFVGYSASVGFDKAREFKKALDVILYEMRRREEIQRFAEKFVAP